MSNVTPTADKDFPKIVRARCGICSKHYQLDTTGNFRENHLCTHCGASGRSQAIAYCLSRYVFGEDSPLNQVGKRPDLKVVGLSDGPAYSKTLAEICDYKNTFYHIEPFLDIVRPGADHIGAYDGLISADVFEHVLAPPSLAFKGAYEVLKPGGYMILTVPFINVGDHKEHYPGLQSYTAEKQSDGSWHAHLEFPGGVKWVDKAPCFHGGPGMTLEIRLFNRARIEEELAWAGFSEVVILDQNIPERGINWITASRPIVARK